MGLRLALALVEGVVIKIKTLPYNSRPRRYFRRLLPFARAGQCAVEEFGGGAVGADPIAPAEQVVNFVGDDYLLERHVLGAQFFDQIGGLPERQHGERLQF